MNEEIETCPECKHPLQDTGCIGLICPNPDCPVNDDALLWDGKGNRNPSPLIAVTRGQLVQVPADRYQELLDKEQQLQAREWAPDGSRKVHIGFYDQIGVNLSPSEYQQGMIRHSVYNICAAETGEVVAWVKPKHLAEIIVALINS